MEHKLISTLMPSGDLGSIYRKHDVIGADWVIAVTVNQPPEWLFP